MILDWVMLSCSSVVPLSSAWSMTLPLMNQRGMVTEFFIGNFVESDTV
jgi:hypothetical protein